MQSLFDSVPSLHRDGFVAAITLRRPGKMNRLTTEDLHVLLAQCRELGQDPSVRVVVITADTTDQKRPVFCAGYDVGGFDDPDHDPRLFEKTVDALAQLPQVVIAVVNGSVYGGATDMVLASDLRLGIESAEFRMPACALGLHYYPSGLQRYVEVLGLNGAKQAFLTASAMSFERLRELGVFMALHTTQNIIAAGDELAQKVFLLAPLALTTTKASLSEIGKGDLNADALTRREVLCLASTDFAEGRQAFAEKRHPRFTGH
ncbi:enoyl-CoA hydratase/isomerase family protein [Limnohabitans sp. Rim8]|uniref:enoyl-CoA hydratase/isomerase family protein n=1 Tax=Limnohabitans sp. Rim8 TaxID=1100718 RepID=UPI0025E24A98|nr:enoyl-CoA hydratase/isomerase family protein [Limnohabitans sp. Rim8]